MTNPKPYNQSRHKENNADSRSTSPVGACGVEMTEEEIENWRWCDEQQSLPAPPLAEAQSADAARTVLPSNDKEIHEAESRGAERGRREAFEEAIAALPHQWRVGGFIEWLRTRATQEGQ